MIFAVWIIVLFLIYFFWLLVTFDVYLCKCLTDILFLFGMQATFFITYVLTSGWASLSSEIMQLFGLILNFFKKYVFRIKEDDPASIPSFPYHTEIPRVLLFVLLGFTCSVLAPLILPFLLVYFFLGYVVYRNQASPYATILLYIVLSLIRHAYTLWISNVDDFFCFPCFLHKHQNYFQPFFWVTKRTTFHYYLVNKQTQSTKAL